MAGRPPHRHAGLPLPQWRQVSEAHLEETGASVVGVGGVHKEDAGVPPWQRLRDGGPVGPKLRATGALDSGPPEGAVRMLVVGVSPPVPRPGKEVPEVQDSRAQPLEGGEDTGGIGPPAGGGWGISGQPSRSATAALQGRGAAASARGVGRGVPWCPRPRPRLC